MKVSLLAIPLAAGLVSACSPMHGPMMGGQGAMPSERMCTMHRQMMAGKTPAEQRAAAEEHIRAMHGSVDDAHVERHMKMMEQRCGPVPSTPR
jgi:hypothetical protein